MWVGQIKIFRFGLILRTMEAVTEKILDMIKIKILEGSLKKTIGCFYAVWKFTYN